MFQRVSINYLNVLKMIKNNTIVQNYKSIIRKLEKNTNMFTLNNILFYITNVSVKKWGIKKYLETNKIGSTVFQNLWDAAKAILRRRSRVI